MMSALWDLIFFAVALGVLVTVHEAGHFFAARACGVKVLRFSVGFGKILFQKTGRDGCEYALSLIPLGGYVKMQGENDDDRSVGSYKSKSVGKRALIIAAGPFCNILLSFLLFTVINMAGVSVLKPVIGDVIPGSAADKSGIVSQSLITEVDGKEVRSWGEVLLTLGLSDEKGEVELTTVPFLGRGQSGEYRLQIETKKDLSNESNFLEELGLRRMFGEVSGKFSAVKPGSPANLAGIRAGDEIVLVNGKETSGWYRVYDAIRSSAGDKLSLVVKRDGQLYETTLIPEFIKVKNERKAVPVIGVMAQTKNVPELVDELKYGPADALKKAFSDTVNMSTLVIKAVSSMLSGAISAENVSGPISIAKGAGESAAAGAVAFLSFLAAISVNLGILNLLPIPVLDGGQLVFIAYEALFRRAPGQKVQRMLTAIGLGILLTLMILAVFNDIRGL